MMKTNTLQRPRKWSKLHLIAMNWQIYVLLIPALVSLIWFRYLPMYGIQIAFKDYNIVKGIVGSPWVGLKHFEKLFRNSMFLRSLRNTLILNLYNFIYQTPMPIFFAILIDSCKSLRYKKIVQTVSYLPHFLSWVIVGALFSNLLAMDTGIVNRIVMFFGGEQQIWLSSESAFRSIVTTADVWKSTGWGTIIYLAAMTGIDPALYEAASIDGAGRWQRIWHITLPGIRSTIAVILIMRAGGALVNDVEMVMALYSPSVYEVGDVLGTYMYRTGIGNMKYSLTSAAGLFTSVIGMLLMVGADWISNKMGERGIW